MTMMVILGTWVGVSALFTVALLAVAARSMPRVDEAHEMQSDSAALPVTHGKLVAVCG